MNLSFGQVAGLSGGSSAFDHYQANRARGWARSMDNTKYQRSVNDLRAAGLNPILAVGGGISGGGGASAPSAPSGSVSQGVQAYSAKAQALTARIVGNKTIDKMSEEIENISANTALSVANTKLANEKAKVVGLPGNLSERAENILDDTSSSAKDLARKVVQGNRPQTGYITKDKHGNKVIRNYKHKSKKRQTRRGKR